MDGKVLSSKSHFVPTDSLMRTNADIFVMFLLGNGVLYLQPGSDDWYRVSPTPFSVSVGGANSSKSQGFYLPLEPASPLGCAEQYQFCNTAIQGPDGCGPLASLRDAIAGVAPHFNTSYEEINMQNSTTETGSLLRYFANVFVTLETTTARVLSHLGSQGLTSKRKLSGTVQASLEPNQWQQDMANIWNTSLALTQAAFIDTVNGPTDPTLLRTWTNYSDPYASKLCNNQVLKESSSPLLMTSHVQY